MIKINDVQIKGKTISVSVQSEIFKIEPDILYQYHIHAGMEMEDETFKQMKRENQELYFYRFAITKLKKSLTSFEIKMSLEHEGAPKEVIESVLNQLVKRKYIDDEAYAHQYVEMKKMQYGPEKIKEELEKKGMNDEIIVRVISNINEKSILNELVPLKIKSIKNKSKKAMMNRVKLYFLQKGFASDLIESVIISHLSDYSGHEIELLKKAYEKLMLHYQDKYTGYELNQIITQKLYQKGFKLEDIRTILREPLDA